MKLKRIALVFACAALLVVTLAACVSLNPQGVATGSITAASATISGDVVITSPANGGNAGAKNEYTGLPRIKQVALGTMTNGTGETTSYMDDSPIGEYTVTVTTTVSLAESTSIYRIGSKSLGVIFSSSAITNAGATRTITNDDLQNNESIGAWLYPTVAITGGDLSLRLTDDGGVRTAMSNTVQLPANKWTWAEFDISGLDGTTGNVVSTFGIVLTGQGAANLGAFTLYVDGVWKWDANDEEALGTAILPDGVLSVMTIPTAAATANTPVMLTENTDYFVHYEDGNDFIVTVTDQSAVSGVALIAY